jgi:hypothetical protein
MNGSSQYVDLRWIGKVLEATYKPGPRIDLDAAKTILKERLTFTDGKDVPVLVIDSGLVSMDKSARDYLSSNEGIKGIRASALISHSKVNSMLVNFVIKISRPNLPVKVFTDREEAMEWLNSFADEEGSNK